MHIASLTYSHTPLPPAESHTGLQHSGPSPSWGPLGHPGGGGGGGRGGGPEGGGGRGGERVGGEGRGGGGRQSR